MILVSQVSIYSIIVSTDHDDQYDDIKKKSTMMFIHSTSMLDWSFKF